MTLRRILIAFLSAAIPAMAAPRCVPLAPGQSIKEKPVAPNHRVCFLVVISPGQAGQFVAEQPVDITIRVSGPTEFTVDGFEFGPETATLETPGAWRIQIEASSSTRVINASLKTVSPEAAAPWRKAEELATLSRHTKKAEDIALSLAAWVNLGNTSAIARTYIKDGRASSNAADFRHAMAAYEEALAGCHDIADARCSAEAANDSGLMAIRLGDYDTALNRLRQALGDWKAVASPELEAVTLSNLGLLYRQSGDYQQAIGWYHQASVFLRSQNTVSGALILNNLGVCYQSLADYYQARSHFERALAQFVALKSASNIVLVRLNLGRTFMLQGDNAYARRLLEQSLSDATAGNYRSLRADALNDLGQLRLAEKAPVEARKLFENARELHRMIGDHRMEASDLYYLGLAAESSGDPSTARKCLFDSLEIRRSGGIRDATADSLIALADIEHAEMNTVEARDFAEQALTALESVRSRIPTPELRAVYYARQHHLFDLLVDLAMDSGNPKADGDGLLAVEQGRGRALLDLLSKSFVGQIPPDLAERHADVQRRIDFVAARIVSAPPEELADLRTRIGFLIAEDDEITAGIRQRASQERLSRPLTSVAELQHALPPDTALVEYYLGARRSWLWVVRNDRIRCFPLPSRSVIESQSAPVLALYRDILSRERDEEKQKRFDTALRHLSATLIGPLRDMALPVRLVLVPDGVLTRVPFAALADHGHRPLGLEHDLLQIPSAAYLLAGKEPRRVSEFPRAFLAITDPVFSLSDPRVSSKTPPDSRLKPSGAPEMPLARLPFADELDLVSTLVPFSRRRVLRGFDANPDELARLPLREFAVLHFSTHALIDDRIPELSRIALSMVGPTGRRIDGFVRPPRFYDFHLDGSVVVLSACDTALGKQVLGEGLMGFTASLFHAGAAQLVLSLSDVDAEGSSAFFVETYRNFFGRRPIGMEHAMTLARRTLAASPRWSDPYYWASFVVYGRPSASN